MIAGNCSHAAQPDGVCYLVGDGGPATSALLQSPDGIILDSNGDILFGERGNHVVRKVAYATGIISTYVGKKCTPGTIIGTSTSTGYPAAFYNISTGTPIEWAGMWWPGILALDGSGNLVIADPELHVVWRVVGGALEQLTGKLQDANSVTFLDAANALDGRIPGASGIAAGPGESLFISDSAIRMLATNATPILCPAGYYCSCGWNPKPCAEPSHFCPANTTVPFPSTRGFMALPAPGIDTGGIVYKEQVPCPLGFFCRGGVATPCLAGTYGTRAGESFRLSCTGCTPGSFIAETGGLAAGTRLSPSSGPSACAVCPSGSTANASSATFCTPCAAGTFMAAAGSSQLSCTPCAPGTYSLPGASACFKRTAVDAAVLVGNIHVFQRALAVSSGNLTNAQFFALLGEIAGLLVFFFSIPALVAFVLFVLAPRSLVPCCSVGAGRSRIVVVKNWVKGQLLAIDQFSMEEVSGRGAAAGGRPSRASLRATAMAAKLAWLRSF